jgi:hypothetical protein
MNIGWLIYILDNNKMIKHRLDNYPPPPQTNVDPKFYTMCHHWGYVILVQKWNQVKMKTSF